MRVVEVATADELELREELDDEPLMVERVLAADALDVSVLAREELVVWLITLVGFAVTDVLEDGIDMKPELVDTEAGYGIVYAKVSKIVSIYVEQSVVVKPSESVIVRVTDWVVVTG